MQIKPAVLYTLGGLLTAGFIAQSALLWQTRQELAEFRGSENPASESIEERLLARLDEKPAPPIAIGAGQSSASLQAGPLFDPFAAFGTDPFTRMEQMRQQMNRVFGTSFSGIGAGGTQFSLRAPEIVLEETAADFRVRIQVPEQHEIELQTEVEDQQVRVYGTVSAEIENQTGNASSRMLSSSQFSRRFDLPNAVDELAVHTTQDEQGLVVVIPKKSDSV